MKVKIRPLEEKKKKKRFEFQNFMAAAATNKVRILCLHGMGRNPDWLKKHLGKIKGLSDVAELCYLRAPHYIGASEYEWYYREDEEIHGADESLKGIDKHLEAQSVPYDIILGFSQGGSIASLLLASHATKKKSHFKKAVLCASGFYPGPSEFNEVLDMPSLHVIGDKDAYSDEGEKMLWVFNADKRVVFRHAKGHVVPSRDANFVETLLDFIKSE
jgi:predicted esterase